MNDPFVSLVVPVLDDAAELESLLDALPPTTDAPGLEVIVVDGGADPALGPLRDRFTEVRWSASLPGRGRQMNHGASLARGRWLIFVHADTRLSPGWDGEIARADATAGVVGGSFRFALETPAWQARLLERGVRWRVRWLDLPYGDQALFVRREAFESVRGYRDWPLMEDVDLVRRLRRVGRLWHSSMPVRVSARRWRRDGWARRSVKNIGLVTLYLAGVAPARLARLYYGRDALRPSSRQT
ncbi:MAG: TIGR04283 family arsenosugar biosynthesis glycosyltransferase [Vicinamibacterales bacterium]|jgi:rSAM/selenodomain-associated transferase 2|nr:glycosyl transferase family 2 [Acidobacteriota bacterium]MDP7294733.1 TIGR04283 family arsenosugar biosynthesis glycosyltransferase [Vicinamibacterales bacterium]MDP7471604.1 TIGR04283 family arsenosugar biosynthesis glycosyltransferase [Vicinamibacterales bacterium]MDP7672161.1 TIGR04283 family arsenosugar biosynthesis glycosyltransferase [Vicinamibacterales bacterium]HJO37340.1 TIGR04283 family arsenosugar biosynthesis glycosyltransferase [Vicinamibacterales bacterium]|tara:strand:- start:345 stop:1070 length:726 start_codon:yes stop_codon:yes gene_type:complete